MRTILCDRIWEFDLAAALRDISSQRREQALAFRHETGRRQCVLAYLLLRQALREDYGLEGNPLFGYGEHGKPFIVGHPELHFSLSHCKEAVGCAIGDSPVGFDVESVRAYKPALAAYTMSDGELAAIAAADHRDVAFIKLWTRKEALLKLTGEGIRNNLKTVLDDCPPEVAFRTVVSDNGRYVYSVASTAAVSKD